MHVKHADDSDRDRREQSLLAAHGAERVVPARELCLEEVAFHEERPRGLEMECFVHGAIVLLLFRPVPDEQYDRRKKRQPGTVCPALSASLYCIKDKNRDI